MPPRRFGFSYRHVLFLLDPDTRAITRFSREFCLPALSEHHQPPLLPTAHCEGVQFVMSVFHAGAGVVGLSYGINDCESALATLTVGHVDAMLEFSASDRPWRRD